MNKNENQSGKIDLELSQNFKLEDLLMRTETDLVSLTVGELTKIIREAQMDGAEQEAIKRMGHGSIH